ncbi:MAG: transposase, partial [Candidatus Heimdallarchaeota archaeon]
GKLWTILLELYDELKGIDWQWQALDSAMVKAPLGGDETGPNPTDRGKSGSKRHLVTDGKGIPLGTTLSGANRHDMKKAADTLDSIVTERPNPEDQEQHMCADKGYDYPETREDITDRGYHMHLPQRGLDTPTPDPRGSRELTVGSTAFASYISDGKRKPKIGLVSSNSQPASLYTAAYF